MNDAIHPTDGPEVQPCDLAGLYLVSTPIGNLRDITLRALDTLKGAEAVICEDSRVTSRLLNAYGIKKRMVVYNDHSDEGDRAKLIQTLSKGAALALVSDAGTPLLSDPGFKLVHDAMRSGVPVIPVPGPSALLPALQLSSLPSDRFLFAGFLPHKSGARKTILGELRHVPATLVFYESPNRVADTIADALAVLGDRPVALARELTKMFEECRHGTLSAFAEDAALLGTLKGECVLLIGMPHHGADSEIDVEDMLRKALKSQSLKDAASFVAAATGMPRKTVYDLALKIHGKH